MSDETDAEKSLKKLPKAHRDLAKGFKISFEPNNTLKGDKGHVGVIMTSPSPQIKIASPWNYPREFAFLHEIAHLVYEKYVRGTQLEKDWEAICKATKEKKKGEPPEELFCHAYSDTYCTNKVLIHHHPEWEKFIKNLPK